MLYYTPKYVRQESDMEYGDSVTHENYNEKLNLNTTQGDYNTAVLEMLFNIDDPESTYHIPYLDKGLEDQALKLEEFKEELTKQNNNLTNLDEFQKTTKETVDKIINGSATIPVANAAKVLEAATSAPNSSYYGKDASGTIGFFRLPEFIYAATPNETVADIDAIYFTPQQNSVDESMLTEAARAKLNKASITSYPELSERPTINGVDLIGDLTLENLGIQLVGNYLSVEEFNEAITGYYTKQETEDYVNDTLTSTLSNYYTKDATAMYVADTLQSYSTVAQTPQVQVGDSFTGTPKNGDILITI